MTRPDETLGTAPGRGRLTGRRIVAIGADGSAIVHIGRHVALEGAPRGIRANHVTPGAVDTPLGRVGDQASAWDNAYATAFLLSGESAAIPAQSLGVDGGSTQFR